MAFRLQVRQVNNLVMNLNYGTYPTAVNKDPTKLNILEDGHIFLFCCCFGFVFVVVFFNKICRSRSIVMLTLIQMICLQSNIAGIIHKWNFKYFSI